MFEIKQIIFKYFEIGKKKKKKPDSCQTNFACVRF